MTSRLASIAAVALALTTLSVTAEAQTSRVHFGPHVSYNFDIEEAGIGVQLGIPMARNLEFYPSADWYLVKNGSLVGLNADLKYRVSGEGLNWMYIGGGLNVITGKPDGGSSNTDSRANLFIGAETLTGAVHPFVELRTMLGNGSATQLAGGINFTLGSR